MSEKTKDPQVELLELEKRKVKAIEKIANSLDALTVWFEEIDKQEWSDRIQYYLAEWHSSMQDPNSPVNKKLKG